ncbi:MAG: macro domain-containing protein [Pseudobdellovibrionaceae bacterium]
MVTYLRGNIFETAAQVITNTVNCAGVMGAGLALEFKNRFPKMFDDYKIRCKKNEVIPGVPYLWEDNSVQILNFPTKRHWKENSLITDIEDGLKYLAIHYQEMGLQSIALLPLGCGLGGLDWQVVKPLVEKHLGGLPDLEVYVYEPSLKSEKTDSRDRNYSSQKVGRDKAAASPL